MQLAKRIADKDTLIIEFEKGVRALSSTIVGNGFKELTHVIFHRVHPDFTEPNPVRYAKGLLEKHGLPEESSAVFLTAVDVVRQHVELHVRSPIEIMLVASIGLSHGICIGVREPVEKPATINVLLLTDKALTDNAFIDLVGVINSAKTLALVDLALSGGYNSGRVYATATDAIVVASAMEGDKELYGGPATRVGSEAAKLVYEAIISAGLKNLSWDERFRNIFGIDVDWIADTASKIYCKAPVPGLPEDKVKEEVKAELRRLLRDPNIWALSLAARDLDWHGLAGALPRLSREEYLGDTQKILVDELLGIALALYVNGWRGLFAYHWIDSIKGRLEEFKDKPMFMDDVLASLIGAILSRIYDMHLVGD